MLDSVGEVACPTCGKAFNQISHHYAEKPNHRPVLEDSVIDVLTGILMGDGSMVNNANHPQMKIDITEPRYLSWLKREYPYLFTSIQKTEREDPHADVYSVKTIPHPRLHEFSSWYRSGEKQFPANLSLTPKMVKHWYCCDGGLNWPGNSDAGASACLYSVNEDGQDIVELFEECGFSPNDHSDHRVYFNREETPTLLGWMGVPPDGFEYKWEWQDKDAYQSRKSAKPVTDGSLSELSNQLVQLAGQLQQVTTQRTSQRQVNDAIERERENCNERIQELKEKHEEEIEAVKKEVREETRRETRNKLIRRIYNNLSDLNDADKRGIKRAGGISQRMLGDSLDLSQQQVANIVREKDA